MKKAKKLFYIFTPITLGGIVAFITKSGMKDFDMLNKPFFTPPKTVFPIVWSVIYLLLGYSFYLYKKKNINELDSVYYAGLVFNMLWSIIFFTLKLRFISFLWILLLDILVLTLFVNFYKVDKKLAYLNIIYIIWLVIATLLNLSIFILN